MIDIPEPPFTKEDVMAVSDLSNRPNEHEEAELMAQEIFQSVLGDALHDLMSMIKTANDAVKKIEDEGVRKDVKVAIDDIEYNLQDIMDIVEGHEMDKIRGSYDVDRLSRVFTRSGAARDLAPMVEKQNNVLHTLRATALEMESNMAEMEQRARVIAERRDCLKTQLQSIGAIVD